MRDSYIGITGFTSPHEVSALVDLIPPESYRKLMVGVCATWKSLNYIPMKPKWAKQTPSPDRISSIFLDHLSVINLVHYSTDHQDTLLEQMRRIIDYAGPNLHGFQLNIPWPNIEQLAGLVFRSDYPYRVVLQISQKAMDAVGQKPQGLISMLKQYVGLIDDILIDLSGGTGKPLDTELVRDLLMAVAEKGWDIGLGAAGGLGPYSLDLVEPLLIDFPNLNIDAQGRLRNQNNDLDIGLAQEYLRKAFNMFGHYNGA